MFHRIGPISPALVDVENEEEVDVNKVPELQALCARKLLSDVYLIRQDVQYLPSILIQKLMEEAIFQSRFLSFYLLMKYWPLEILRISLPSELKGYNVHKMLIKRKYQGAVDKLSDVTMVVLNNFFKLAKSDSFEGKLKILDLSEVPLSKYSFQKMCKEIKEDNYDSNENKFIIKANCHLEIRHAVRDLFQVMKTSGLARIQLIVTGLQLSYSALNSGSIVSLLESLSAGDLQKLSFGFANLDIGQMQQIFESAKKFHNLRTLEFSNCITFSRFQQNFCKGLASLVRELVHVNHLTFHRCNINNMYSILQSLNSRDCETAEKNVMLSPRKMLKTSCLYPDCRYTSYDSLQYVNLTCLLNNEDILCLANCRHIKNLKHLAVCGQSFGDHYESASLLLTSTAHSLHALEILELHLEQYQIGPFLSIISGIKNLRFLGITFVFVTCKELLQELPILHQLEFLKCFILNKPPQHAFSDDSCSDFISSVESIIKSFNRDIDVSWCS